MSPGLSSHSARHATLAVLLVLAMGDVTSPGLLAAAGRASAPRAAAGADLFQPGVIPRIAIRIQPQNLESLRRHARQFVPATVREGGLGFEEVGVHLKGSTGSFQGLDAKPGLTLDFARFHRGQRFHELRRIHLNNSVEDPAFVNEVLGGELFRAAGVPAPRVTRAWVTLNGRPLGLYVLKEGFTEDFLAASFGSGDGNLYDTDWGHDVDQRMKRNLGRGQKEGQPDLDALAAAAQEPDPDRRWQRLAALLDMDRFLSFMALEVMFCHRDGYSLARNNFRIYHDPVADRLVLLPAGMDQLLGKADLPWRPQMAGVVARAVMELPEGRRQFTERFGALLARGFDVGALTNRVNALVAEVRPLLRGDDLDRMVREAGEVCGRLVRRQAFLEAALRQPEPAPIELPAGVTRLGTWFKVDAPPGGGMELVRDALGRPSLHIRAGPATAASWRAVVLLTQGRYRFEGRARVAAVQPLPYGRHQGAALRVSGQTRASNGLVGDSTWQPLTAEFEVGAGTTKTELICELRASGGEAWFDFDSLRLVRRE
jgi:hypothetical protein